MKLLTKVFIAAFIIGAGFMIGRVYMLYPLLNTFSIGPSLTLGGFNRTLLSFCVRMIAEFVAVIILISGFLWIWSRRSDWMLRSLMLTALLVFGWRCGVLYEKAMTPFLRVSLQSSVEGQAQLFYDKGRSFNEIDSQKAYVGPDSQYQDCFFPLPRSVTIYSFRFDPLAGSGAMWIREMAIVNGLGHSLLVIDPRQWHPGQQIREFNLQNHEVIVVTEKDANDPQLILGLSSPLVLNGSRSFMTYAFLGRVLLECLMVAIITALVLIILKTYRKPMLLVLTAKKNDLKKSASRPLKTGMLWDVLFLLTSLFLLQVYFRGNWEDTIGFVRAWLNG